MQATTLMVARRFADEAVQYRGRSELTILPPPCPLAAPADDFAHAEELTTRAEADARAVLDHRALPVLPLRRRRARPEARHLSAVESPPGA